MVPGRNEVKRGLCLHGLTFWEQTGSGWSQKASNNQEPLLPRGAVAWEMQEEDLMHWWMAAWEWQLHGQGRAA